MANNRVHLTAVPLALQSQPVKLGVHAAFGGVNARAEPGLSRFVPAPGGVNKSLELTNLP